jgi:arylformamidase
MVVWPGDPNVKISLVNSIELGDEANVTSIKMSAHSGTHIDSPRHFIKGGKPIEGLELDILIGEVEIIEIDKQIASIDATILQNLVRTTWPKRIIFKTNNSFQQLFEKEIFYQDFVALTADAAEFLIEQGVKLIGIDYLSIAPFENGAETHNCLLEKNIIIVEGLNLNSIQPGIYELIALPIKLEGADGAPARVLLIQD